MYDINSRTFLWSGLPLTGGSFKGRFANSISLVIGQDMFDIKSCTILFLNLSLMGHSFKGSTGWQIGLISLVFLGFYFLFGLY